MYVLFPLSLNASDYVNIKEMLEIYPGNSFNSDMWLLKDFKESLYTSEYFK